MGASISSCCQDGKSKAEDFVTEVKEKGIVEASSEAASSVAEKVQEKAEKVVEDAKSGKLAEDVKEAATAAVEQAQQVVEDAKSGKLAEDVQAAAEAAKEQLAAAAASATATAATVSDTVVAAAGPEAPSLIMTFEYKGKTVEQKWENRPIGIELGAKPAGCCSGSPPGKFVVKKVVDANLKDIKVGMLIQKLDGQDVKPATEWPEFKAMLDSKLQALPEK